MDVIFKERSVRRYENKFIDRFEEDKVFYKEYRGSGEDENNS